jgi:hypothetical protein
MSGMKEEKVRFEPKVACTMPVFKTSKIPKARMIQVLIRVNIRLILADKDQEIKLHLVA